MSNKSQVLNSCLFQCNLHKLAPATMFTKNKFILKANITN